MRMKVFRRCLAVFCAAVLSVGSLAAMPAAAETKNLITNSTFDSGTTGWGTYQASGGSATLSAQNGKLALQINSVGKLNYSVQCNYDVIPLYKNGVYHVSYEISSTTDRYVEAMIQQNGGTYQAYTWKGIDLTSEPQTIDYEFTMKQDTDIMSKLVFNCGLENGEDLDPHTIYLDNVKVELVDDSKVEYDDILPYAPSIITDQVGYQPEETKTAVFRDVTNETSFSVVNQDSGKVVYTGELSASKFNSMANETDWTGDFSAITEPGTYYITCGGLDQSYAFTIGEDVYNGLLDDTVRMLYLQRCGTKIEDDTFGHAACHNTLATVYHTSDKIDVSGGWHDAGDYGRYVVPGAKSVADLLIAYGQNPGMFSDSIGIPESGNGVPDVLDEARYELEWMLKMQDRPVEEYECNARGIDLRRNFPTNYYQRKRVNQEPASENETRALISIFQEYSSLGLLTFSYSRGKIVYCRQEKGFAYNQKNYRLARHLQKCSGYRLEKGIAGGARVKKAGAKPEMGSPEQFYAEVIRQPSLAIEIPEYRKDDMEELRLIPLEYLYSLNSGILANA